ncbi:TP53-binding protein 1 isoform X1 [Tachysurus fulvidraco]|uniref:TP53-binding protein 1 isoform X1 n=1 Tax=Tachysurus fulvidraco TaxID=1234273 RepID=UPI001FEF0DFC|nr:TP53-binding protein 1 isoform X1 [Tachysurus fulvidraco]XP_047667123.1 TP53-binding protein 1 isoform X1 [Tachysurus fulvidraco]XP_047667135.1 TP53-binding protein 1 isoform X1 [Tachysurus fulvidraco]
MDPGGSDLESSLPQTENPCLIVEDSQPESVALEDDPDSSYRALLSRRLSNLQPTSHSPVLELIASPSKGRCTESDCQTEKSNSVPEADRCPSNPSSAAEEQSQVFEVCSLPNTKRSNQEAMESGADSTTHCVQSDEGMSQFGLLELSESQGGNIERENIESDDEDVEETPVNLQPSNSQKTANQTGLKSSSRASDSQDDNFRKPEVSSSSASVPQRREGRELSVHAILHSRVSEAEEAEDEELMSSQDDLFDGEKNGSKVDSTVAVIENQQQQDPTCTPADLCLLHLSAQASLVQESLSQQSVDFVAATQEDPTQPALIVPDSPTGQENEQDFNEATEPAKETSGMQNDQAQKGQEEIMDVDPAPKPTESNVVSQNSPNFAFEKSLSLPTQPELSHDVFVPTPSLESGVCSPGPEALKKKEAPKESLSTIIDAEALKQPAGSSSSQVSTGFQLELDTENSVFDKKTQAFPVDDDSQATQIEEIQGSVGEGEEDCGVPVQHDEKTDKSSMDCGLNNAANVQGISQGPDLKTTENEECSSQKLSSQSSKGQNRQINDSVAKSQEISNTLASQKMNEMDLGKDLTLSSCSQSKEQSEKPTSTSPVPSQSQSQSVIFSHRSPPGEGEQEADGDQRPSQSFSQSHQPNLSISNTKNVDEEDDDKMDEGAVQSTSRNEGPGFDLTHSRSQIGSPEPMEDEGEVSQHAGSKDEESLSVIVLEESERVSQERQSIERSPVFRSSSQPLVVSPKEKFKPGKKPGSQPNSSGQSLQVATKTGANNTQASDGAPSGGSQVLNTANKSLSDSSGDLPFHFTLPREGELIGPSASATPPHVRQLKNTPLHSTPIETSIFRERTKADATRETTMAASEISVEESGEGEELAAQGGDGKLSLRMKVVTPVEDGSSGSERFSLQKPSLSDEEGTVSKATAVAKAVTSPQSIFTRVREVHKQLQVEDEEKEPSDLSVRATRPRSQTDLLNSENPDSAPGPVGNGTPGQSLQQTNGTAMHSEPLAAVQSSTAKEHEAPSTSGQSPHKSLISQRAVSQQSIMDLSSKASPLSKRAVSQQTSFDASGPQLPSGRGEPVTPSRSQSGPSHRRHVRTIQEVRTTITRIITDVYYEDGREVDRKVVEETEEPVVDRCVMDSDISPSRTGSSMTSGDLADVSSLSSKAASHFSSSGTSSGGPAPSRLTDFIMPSNRGAKPGSPRRGGRQVVGSELTGVWGSLSTAPLSPRGHGRRGRPPSRGPLSRGGRSAQRGGAHGPTVSSSEDEHLARTNARVPSSRLDALNTTSPENSAGSGSSFVGLRVMAKWSSNSFFYSGTITRDLGENRFRLLFDDNQECEAQGKDILLCDPIPLEAEVTALTEEEYFNTGIVKAHKRQGAELLYCVEKDGQSTWYCRTAVILTMEQGSRLREQYGLGPYEPSTPQNMASDISLDNLVEGKRRRRGNGTGPGTPNSSSTNSPKTPAKRKLTSSTEDEKTPAKRGRRVGGARLGLKMAPCDTSGSGAELPSDPSDHLVMHGPLPESTSLFMGFVFMLTASSDNDMKSNQTTSDGEEEYVPTAPYNKQYTKRQLEAGGGMILPEFNEEQCKAAYQSLLIADKHCRTETYLLCVAGGVPCVSQIWVRDCCQEKKLMNYRNYLLPAGVGPEQRIIEWHVRCTPFKALKVLLVSEERVDLWTSLLTMCGSAKVQQHKISNNSSDTSVEGFDLVVSASPCPEEVLKCVMATNTPVVSLEWLVQCVICGERLAYSSQPEYNHDYSS